MYGKVGTHGRVPGHQRNIVCAVFWRVKENMHLNTNTNTAYVSRFSNTLKPEQPQHQGILTRQELQRIVAAMVG